MPSFARSQDAYGKTEIDPNCRPLHDDDASARPNVVYAPTLHLMVQVTAASRAAWADFPLRGFTWPLGLAASGPASFDPYWSPLVACDCQVVKHPSIRRDYLTLIRVFRDDSCHTSCVSVA